MSRKLGSSRSWREMSCMFELGLRSAETVVDVESGKDWRLNDIRIILIRPNIFSAAVHTGDCPKPSLLASILSYHCASSDLLMTLVLQSRSAEWPQESLIRLALRTVALRRQSGQGRRRLEVDEGSSSAVL